MPKKKNEKSKAPQFDAAAIEASEQTALAALQQADDRAQGLIDAWVAQQNVAALQAVALSDSKFRKPAKRALAVLKSRGVKLPEPKPVAAPAPEPQLVHEAWFLVPDPSGVSVITIGSHTSGERWSVVDVQVHEVAGVIDVSPGEATGSSIRNAFQTTRSRRGIMPTPVPVEWARWRIAQARKRNAKSGLVIPLGMTSAAPLLDPVPEQEPLSPLAGLEVTDRDLDRARSSGTLHNEPEFRGWLPDPRMMQELLGKVGERLGPDPNQQPAEKVNELFEQEISAATDRFFNPEVRGVIAERMKDCAISVLARVGKERALDVLATAEASKRAGLITAPPSEIPFLKSFFQKGLAVMASNSGGRISIPIPQGAQQQNP